MSKTLFVIILDESGSMEPVKSNIMAGLLQFMVEQNKIVGDSARLILLKFNKCVKIMYNCHDFKSTKLAKLNYQPYGNSALFDAAINGIILAEAAKREDEKVFFITFTDGEDNASDNDSEYWFRYKFDSLNARHDWHFHFPETRLKQWRRLHGIREQVSYIPMDFSPGITFHNLINEISKIRIKTFLPQFDFNKDFIPVKRKVFNLKKISNTSTMFNMGLPEESGPPNSPTGSNRSSLTIDLDSD